MTFLFAGHETTALSMTWAIYHLLKNKPALSSLRKELDSLPDDSPSSLSSSSYLKATIQETLRIHPIVTETLRKLKSPMQFLHSNTCLSAVVIGDVLALPLLRMKWRSY